MRTKALGGSSLKSLLRYLNSVNSPQGAKNYGYARQFVERLPLIPCQLDVGRLSDMGHSTIRSSAKFDND